MRRWLVGLVTIAAVLWAGYRFGIQNRVEVRNASGQVIPLLEVSTGKQTIRFEDLEPGDARSSPFRIVNDDQFVIRGRLADGTPIAADEGYLTNGFYRVRATIVVLPWGGVEFRQSNGFR